MSVFFEILVRIASYGPQTDQSHGENRLSHIIKPDMSWICVIYLPKSQNAIQFATLGVQND